MSKEINMKSEKLVVPVDRSKHVEQVFEEKIGDLVKNWSPDKVLGTTSFIRFLVHSTEAWDELSRWRMEVRTEGLRRYEMSPEYVGHF